MKRRHQQPPALPDHEGQPPAVQREPVTAGATVLREPLVQRADWADPDDASAQARLRSGARRVQGWRRIWSIDALHEGSPREITKAHVGAAQKLLGDYEIGIEGASPDGGRLERVDGAVHEGLHPWSARIRAAQRYREAVQALGEQAAFIVTLVVIDNWTMVRLSQALGTTRDRAFGRLQAGLERLREHYQPPRQNAAAGPAAEHEEAVLDPGISDLPPERLGRWERPQQAPNPDTVVESKIRA